VSPNESHHNGILTVQCNEDRAQRNQENCNAFGGDLLNALQSRMQRCNDQETFNDCLTPMQRLATAGMSMLLPHRLPRNGDLDSVSHDFGCFFGMDCLRIRISHTR
jgi:hypothetical protein